MKNVRKTAWTLAALAVGAGAWYALAAAGGEEGLVWRIGGRLPERLTVRRVVPTGEDTGIVAGTLPGDVPAGAGVKERLAAEHAAIFRSTDGGDSFQQTLDTPGAVVAVDFWNAEHAWAVVARPRESGEGSNYFLFSTQDGGAAWREIGGIPARSVTQVARTGLDRGWVMGAKTLLRTTDTGANWKEVPAPGTRNAAGERMVADGPDGLTIVGQGALRTKDGGATWEKLAAGTAKVQAARGDLAVGVLGAQVLFGKLNGQEFDRMASLPPGARVDSMVVEGQVVRLVATVGSDREVVLLQSGDGGATFATENVTVVPAAHHVGLCGPRVAWCVALDRQVIVTP